MNTTRTLTHRRFPFFRKLRIDHLEDGRNAAAEMNTDPDHIRATLQKFSGKTAIGSDQGPLKGFSKLPDAALEGLGAIFKQSVATLTVPGQELLNILCLLGKKLGGSRTIAIMPSVYRALMKSFGLTLRELYISEGHVWDSAIAGSSSLRAAVLRALMCENGVARGEHVAHLLWDMKQFYDSVSLQKLTE